MDDRSPSGNPKALSTVTLTSDKQARNYVFREVMRYQKKSFRPLWVFFICMPICALVAAALFKYDTVRPHSWMCALGGAPAMCLVVRGLPYLILVLPNRWRFDHEGFTQTGGYSSGRIRFSEVKSWKVQPIQDLEGYHLLSVATDAEETSIVLSTLEYPFAMISTLFPIHLSAMRVGALR